MREEGEGTYSRAKVKLFLPKARDDARARATEARSVPQLNLMMMMMLLYQVELEGGRAAEYKLSA